MGIIAPDFLFFKAIFVARITSKSTEPAFGASTVLNLRSMRMGALQK